MQCRCPQACIRSEGRIVVNDVITGGADNVLVCCLGFRCLNCCGFRTDRHIGGASRLQLVIGRNVERSFDRWNTDLDILNPDYFGALFKCGRDFNFYRLNGFRYLTLTLSDAATTTTF